MTSVHVLPPDADSMCAFCCSKASYFIVVSYSFGDLKPACAEHANTDLYG